MSKVPSLPYLKIINALQRDGWIVVRQKGSHIRLHKRIGNETLKITVPAHKPVKGSTLSHILKQARIDVESFLKLV
jgi:predicted RNA binding protein YcfA (HicA-like mRNA interferase family)